MKLNRPAQPPYSDTFCGSRSCSYTKWVSRHFTLTETKLGNVLGRSVLPITSTINTTTDTQLRILSSTLKMPTKKKKIWSDQPLNTNTDCANWLLITLPTRIICPSFGVNCHILNRFIRKSLCVRLSSKHHVNRFSTVACQRQHQQMKSCPLLQLRSHLLFVTMLQSRFSQKIHMAFLQHCLLCC